MSTGCAVPACCLAWAATLAHACALLTVPALHSCCRVDTFLQLQQPPLERCASSRSSTEVHQEPAVGAEECPGGEGARPLTVLNRYRALVLDSSYQPIDVVNWQRAICLEIATQGEERV